MDELNAVRFLVRLSLFSVLLWGLSACSQTPTATDKPQSLIVPDSSKPLNLDVSTPAQGALTVPGVGAGVDGAPHYLVATTDELWDRLGTQFDARLSKPEFTAEPGPTLPDNLWDRIRNGFAMPYRHHPKVRKQAEEFAESHDYLEKVIERAKPYLFYVVEEIEKRGMPTEIALVPVIESAYLPSASSLGGATGVWQFIPSTGKNYGLNKTFWYDGRRDVIASTGAALKYLEKLNTDFNGDWLLTLAAYNSGEGTVLRAVKRNQQARKPIDFWSLDLPAETRAYVPRLLAIAALVNEPDAFGAHLGYVPNTPYLASVDLDTQINLKLAAKMADISHDEIRHLNAGFTTGLTDPKGDHPLMLPANKVAAFNEKLAAWVFDKKRQHTKTKKPVDAGKKSKKSSTVLAQLTPPTPPDAPLTTYKVKEGDSLSAIAQRFKITVAQLQEWNADLLTGKYLKPGRHLKLYLDNGAQTIE